jgi:hypothetical protein
MAYSKINWSNRMNRMIRYLMAVMIVMATPVAAEPANGAIVGSGGVSCAGGKCIHGVAVLENGVGGSNTIIVDTNARQVCQIVFPNSKSGQVKKCLKY